MLDGRRTVIEFDAATHRYRLDGQPVPSVTQVLDPYTGLEFVNADLLRRAAEFGSHVHEACHLFNQGALDTATLDPALAPYVAAWSSFLEDSDATVLLSEHRVASRKLGFAGTLDTIVWWGKSKRLVDIKTSAGVPKTVGPQTAAYATAYREQTGEALKHRYCVQLKENGKYALRKLDDPQDWQIFQSALILNRWFYNGAHHA